MNLLNFHEVWTDEVQAWELQKNNNFFGMYQACKTEGHPMLWYVILKPFTAMGFDISVMNIISITFMTVAVFMFWRYVNIQTVAKVATVLSQCMFYYNAINARTYSLATLAMVLIMITYPNRKEHPYKYGLSLQLLAQTHILLCGFIGAFWIVWVYDTVTEYRKSKNIDKNNIAAFLIYSASIVWLLMQLSGFGVPSATTNEAVFQFKDMDIATQIQMAIVQIVLNIINIIQNLMFQTMYQITSIAIQAKNIEVISIIQGISESIQMLIMLISCIAQIVILVHLWNRDKRKLFIVLLGQLSVNLVSYFVTGMNVQRLLVSLQAIILIAISEIDNNDKDRQIDKLQKYCTYLLLCISIVFTWQMAYRQINCTFGLDTAQTSKVMDCLGEDDTLIVLNDTQDIADTVNSVYLLNKPFYNVYKQEYCYYIKFNQYADEQFSDLSTQSDVIIDIAKSGLDLSNTVVLMRVGIEVQPETTDEAYYKFVYHYFDIEYETPIYGEDSVQQFNDAKLQVLRPNSKLIDAVESIRNGG